MHVAIALLLAASAGATPAPEEAAAEISLSSGSPDALAAFRRGRDLFESSREFEAKAQFEKAVALDARFAFAWAMLAQCPGVSEPAEKMDRAVALGAKLGVPERAMLDYWRALQKGDDKAVEASLSHLGELAAGDWRIELLLGERAVDAGRGEEAVKLFRRAVELNPQAAEAFNHLGFALSDLGQHDAAITAMRRYAALKRDDPNPLDSLGEVLLRANRLEDAEAAFRKASANPQFWYAAAGVATARFFAGDFEGGRKALREELPLAPDASVKVRLQSYIAWTLLAEGRRAEGLAALDAAEEQARAASPALHAQLAVTRGAFYVLAGEPEAALPLLDAGLERGTAKKLSGAEQNALRRSVASWRIRALAQGGHAADAAKLLAALEAEAAGDRGLAAAQGLRAALAEAKGDAATALAETTRCAQVDWLCRLQRVRLASLKGDRAGADEAARALLSERRRDTVWTSLEPTYLWVWVQLRPQARAAAN
ncbi:MAG TPA: tetratricopeptide repeat protein [Myxococcales bacterium]|nr:tetratricopeptide repeat protein [Myxococcales bacterium]